MQSGGKLKKNGTIEVRLPDQVKTAFARQCQMNGRTVSEAVRSFIDDDLAARPRRSLASGWRIGIAGLTGAVLGLGLAAPSIASSVEPTRSAFDRLDGDHDGRLTYQEFRAR